jgi:hypothetical protein
MRRVLDLVLTLNLIALMLLITYWWFSEQLVITYQPVPQAAAVSLETQGVLFGETLRTEVDRQLGVPTEGYRPEMFIEVFPGLALTDFEDVAASVGKYVVVEGQLVHVIPPGALSHSAAQAIAHNGYETLLANVARRLQIDLVHSGTITQVLDSISR